MLKTPLVVLVVFFVCTTILFVRCTKNANPQPPIHDTVTVIKNDTTKLTDTLYASKPDSTVNLTKGLLVYLPFSGNIADSSGNSNPTYAVGSVLTYDAHGYANSAFGATGAGQRVIVVNNGSIKFDTAWALSFGFTVNAAQVSTYISMIDTGTGLSPSFNIGTSQSGTPNLVLGSEDISLGCGNYGENNNYDISDTSNFVPVPGSWYKAIAIYHRGSEQLYINGQLISSKTGLGTLANLCPNAQLVIGGWWLGGPSNFQNINGKLDNIRLYNRVLTPHEIAVLSTSYQVTSNSVKATPRTAH